VVGASESGEYRIKHWFEPTRYGFVKFEVDMPGEEKVTLELEEVITQ